MKWIKYTILFFSAALLTLLDTSFFPNIIVKNTSIVSVFQLIVIFAFLADAKKYLFFTGIAIIFFSIFSSLPVWLIFVLFFVLPGIIIYLRKGHLPLPSMPIALILFMIINFMFELVLLLYVKEWNKNGFTSLYYFVIINTLFGVILYYFFHSYLNVVTRGGKIKNI